MQSPCSGRCVGPRRCLCVSGSVIIQLLLLDMVLQVHLADFEPSNPVMSVDEQDEVDLLEEYDEGSDKVEAPMMDFTSQHKLLDVAVCISGNLRTFIDPPVFGRIRPFHEKLGRVRDLQFFLYGTLTGAGEKNVTSRNFKAINVSNRSALDSAVASLGPSAVVEITDNAEEVVEENIGQYVLHLECFKNIRYTNAVDGIAFFEDRARLLRGLNQLAHIIKAFEMMMASEQKRRKLYDIVVLTRPDLRYNITSIKGGSLLRLVQAGKVVLQNDQWMAMPRKVASRVYALGKLLNCMPGRRCCRRIDKPESLMEYLTGAVHDFHRSLHPGDRGQSMSCQCSNVSTPFRRVKVGQIQRMPIYTDDVH